MPIKLNAASGGSVSFDVPSNTSSTFTLTAPARTGTIITSADSGSITSGMIAANAVTQSSINSGVVGKGALFLVKQTSTQTLSNGVTTKLTFTTKVYDTDNCYDTTTSRFTPTTAGYYHITCRMRFGAVAAGQFELALYKNGSLLLSGNINQQGSNDNGVMFTGIAFCNGSTDYLEMYCNQNAGTLTTVLTDNFGSTGYNCYWTGHLVRSA